VAEEQVADVSQEEVAPSATILADTETLTDGDWRDQLPDDLRDHQSLQNITDVGALAKTMIHAQSMVGAEKIPVPGKWASDDDWNQVYQKLGRPDEADGYEFDFGDQPLDDDFVNNFRSTAHDAGLSARQAQKLVAWYTDIAREHGGGSEEEIQHAVEAAKTAAETELKKEYGNALKDRLEMGDNLLNEFGAEGIMELTLADGTPLVNNPAFIKTVVAAAHWINESVSEDKLIGDKGSTAMTPAEADQKIAELMRPDGPYWDARHPQHQSYVDQVLEMQKQKHPEEE
jgi:hypothetical protein